MKHIKGDMRNMYLPVVWCYSCYYDIFLCVTELGVVPYNRGAVKSTCKMMMELGIGSRDVYEDDFERPLLEESREFYRVR